MGLRKTALSCQWRMSLFVTEGMRRLVESVLWFYVSYKCEKGVSTTAPATGLIGLTPTITD